MTGRVQIQVWYHDDRNELVVNLLAADDLALRDEQLGYGLYPEGNNFLLIFVMLKSFDLFDNFFLMFSLCKSGNFS